MNTRILMASSAAFVAALGLAATFLSHETLVAMEAEPLPVLVVTVQIAGALYLGFAMLNWMAKGVLIGGIYSRPLAMANFLHFFVAAITLLKALPALNTPLHIAVTACYVGFAAAFGFVLFTHPRPAIGPEGMQ